MKFQDFKDYKNAQFIRHIRNIFQWNISKTADTLDIQRNHLYNKMEKYWVSRI